MELNELRKTAEAATSGPWECVEGDEAFGVRASVGSVTWDDHSGEVFKKEDAEFIATFNPETVLALLSRLEQAEQAVQRVREVHRPVSDPFGVSCAACIGDSRRSPYPCDTIRALDGGQDV